MLKLGWNAASAIAGLILLLPFGAAAQTSNDAAGQSILRRAFVVLTGGNPISDVRLEGSATITAGSDEERGQAILEARDKKAAFV